MFPEELEAVTVDFDGVPGMGLNQPGKVFFQLFHGQLIGTAVEILTDPAHGPGVDINGFFGLFPGV